MFLSFSKPIWPRPPPRPLSLGCGYRRMFIAECLKKRQHALLHVGRGHFGRCVSLVQGREARAVHGVGSFDFGTGTPHLRPHRRCLCNQTLLVLDLKGEPEKQKWLTKELVLAKNLPIDLINLTMNCTSILSGILSDAEHITKAEKEKLKRCNERQMGHELFSRRLPKSTKHGINKISKLYHFLTIHAAWSVSEMIPASGSHQNTWHSKRWVPASTMTAKVRLSWPTPRKVK